MSMNTDTPQPPPDPSEFEEESLPDTQHTIGSPGADGAAEEGPDTEVVLVARDDGDGEGQRHADPTQVQVEVNTLVDLTHVSETSLSKQGKKYENDTETTSKFRALSKDDFVKYQRELFDQLDFLKEDNTRLLKKVRDLELKLTDYNDMKRRLQMSHDYHKSAAPFVAWYTQEFPDYKDCLKACQGQCGRTELDGVKINKYTCNTRECVDLHMCYSCSKKHTSCFRCKCPLMNEEGWCKKRRLTSGQATGIRFLPVPVAVQMQRHLR